jgi:tetratricopeptide (TPR) repeat protein
VEVDFEQFDQLIDRINASTDKEEQLACALDATALYKGDFLSRLSSEVWVRPIATYYHDLYLKIALQALEGLREQQRYKEAAELGEHVLQIDPYNEELYQILMKNCIDLGDCDKAASLYDKLSKLYLADLGIMPAEETRRIYYDAIKVVNNTAIPYETLEEQLEAPLVGRGALVCDYNFFKYIYNSTARQLERNGVAAHLVMLTLTDKAGGELSTRSRDVAMDHLESVICSGLRRTDVVSRCSVSQFVLLLPMSNFENSGMVSNRLIKAFYRQYPHSPAKIEYTVHPLKTENG